jgi:hypothetical protein
MAIKYDPSVFKVNGSEISWEPNPNDHYRITGIYGPRGNKLAPIQSKDWNYIRHINVYKGTFWLVRNGKRYKIQTVVN